MDAIQSPSEFGHDDERPAAAESARTTGTGPVIRMAGGRTVVVVGSDAEYVQKANEVDRDRTPLPVFAEKGRRFDDRWSSLPPSPFSARRWQGAVFVCGPTLAAVGEVLARATGRQLLFGEFGEAVDLSGTIPVTVVAGTEEITPERLTTISTAARLGLFTARSLAAASALAIRTLLYGPAAAHALGDLTFDVTIDGDMVRDRLTGDRVTPGGLRTAIGDGVAVLAGRGHGRDCLMSLEGGGICGRAMEQPLLSQEPAVRDSWSEHLTSCQQGHGCWRDDVEMSNHLRASEVRAAFVVLDSCLTAVVGAGSVRPDVSIPLTMIEGSAIAVACAAGLRAGSPYVGQLFQSLLRAGLPLGDVIREVNGAITADREGLGSLVLFGDAGLIAAPTSISPCEAMLPLDRQGGVDVPPCSAAVLVAGGAMMRTDRDGPLIVRRGHGNSCWVMTEAVGRSAGRIVTAPMQLDNSWIGWVRPWLNRLRDLIGMGLHPDTARLDSAHRKAVAAVRARAQAEHVGAAKAALTAFETALDEVARIQSRLVEDEIRLISTSFHAFVENWPAPWKVHTVPTSTNCPQCGADSVVRHHIRTAGGAGPELLYLVCMRCGDVLAGAMEFPASVVVHAPPEVRGGEPFEVAVTVAAPPDWPVKVAIGAGMVFEKRFFCSLTDTRSFALAPGERRTVAFQGTSDAARTIPDLQAVNIVIAANGAARCYMRSIWIRSVTTV